MPYDYPIPCYFLKSVVCVKGFSEKAHIIETCRWFSNAHIVQRVLTNMVEESRCPRGIHYNPSSWFLHVSSPGAFCRRCFLDFVECTQVSFKISISVYEVKKNLDYVGKFKWRATPVSTALFYVCMDIRYSVMTMATTICLPEIFHLNF